MQTKTIVPRAATALGASLEGGATLPATWYTDPAVFAVEQERIFRRCWQYVGLLEQVSHPGDYFTCVAGTVPLIVARDGAGTLRALVNVCRHRGHQVASEEHGHCTVFQCPYHAWSYNLDGTLRGVPGMRDEPGFDRDQFPLIQVQAETWGPFIFVNPSGARGGNTSSRRTGRSWWITTSNAITARWRIPASLS
ncbi:MAG: Rieske (2Fe-2S) protein [Thermomicrobia bacterium]|nr:Rieske (2Fe-2S) protein [Thermomicrobia bacterium]